MNQLAVIDDLAAKRSAAARKAVETRRLRLQGLAPAVQPKAPAVQRNGNAMQQALAAFELEANAAAPDWHKAALLLKQALTERQSAKVLTIKPPKAAVIAAPVFPDYPVNRVSSFNIWNPTIVVTFADGEVVRAPAVSKRGHPVNIGRGLRVAVAFYQARAARKRVGKRIWPRVPEITACHCEATGENYNPDLCTIRTIEARKAKPR